MYGSGKTIVKWTIRIVGYPGPGLWEPYGFSGIYASQVVCKLGGYENSLIRESDTACPNGTFANSNDPNICYKIYSDPLNWYAAEQSCTKGNGHLVSVHNSDENAFFLSAIYFHVPNAVDFWTGGFVNNKTWKWSDGSAFDFSIWYPGLAMDPYVSWTAFGLFGNADSWQWLDGTPVDYTKWYQSPPKPSVNNCGLMLTDSGNSDISKWQPFFDIGHISQVACEVNAF
uniref:C-type lectin domain-containing protein n=1 Tax=Panagrolaimus davidi TaxID=227884 RepID=A0A914PV85_9BILA